MGSMHPAIQNLYATFSVYRLNEKIKGHYCALCLSEAYNQFLHETPLAKLTAETLLPYLTSADIIDETCNDFKYFVPRLLEIAFESSDQTSYYFDIAWKQIGIANPGSWHNHEITSLKAFAAAYLQQAEVAGNLKYQSALEDLQEAGLDAL